MAADAWSGLTDSSIDRVCEGGCSGAAAATARMPSWTVIERSPGRRSRIGPAVFGLALVLAPLIGLFEALRV